MTPLQNILADLVEFQTTNDNPEANHQALAYIETFLRGRGLLVTRHNFNGVESLYASPHQSKHPKVLLAGHVDVIAAPSEAFTLTEKDGKLFGRGTMDMKSAVAAYLKIVDDLDEHVTAYDFGIMITTDEEDGGRNGVRALLAEGGYSADVCVLPDGGDNWKFERSAKGIIRPHLEAKGISSHGSRTWEGESAIEKMINFLRAFQYEVFADQGPHTNTLNIGMIKGGEAANQVPDFCSADLDIRTLTKADADKILKDLDRLATQYDIGYTLPLNDSPLNIDTSEPLVQAFVKSMQRTLGHPIEYVNSLGGSDARYFAEHHIPTLVTYPIGGGHHGPSEWVDKQALHDLQRIIQDYLDTVARK